MFGFLKNLRPSCATKRPATRRTSSFRPALESLEDRHMPSSSGVLSAVTLGSGQVSVFAIGADGRLYGAYTGSGWTTVSDGYSATFSEVSAGMDSQGQAHCFAIRRGDGHLWEFNYGANGYHYWSGIDHGGNWAHISATTQGNCFMIGASDHMVYRYDCWSGSTSWMLSPSDGAVQISAGVDQWGQDKVYIVDTYGYVLADTSNGSGQWLHDSHWNYLLASQVSAGIGSNSTGTDLYYISSTDGSLHSFDGTTDQPLGGVCLQISAALNQYGQRECYAIGTNHCLYMNNGSSWQFDGGQMTQITAAAHDMVFAVEPGDNHILAYDPDYIWATDWFNHYDYGTWHWSGNGVSATPSS
jgi:hypothetical protein